MKKGLAVVGIILLVLAPLIVVSGTVYTLMLPNIYAASCRMIVTEEQPRVNPFSAKGATAASYDPYFLRNQAEIMQSRPVLTLVMNRLNLQEAWGAQGERLPQEVCMQILQNSLSVKQERDTTLFEIIVKTLSPDECARIANETAEAYRDCRMDAETKNLRERLDGLNEILKDQSERVLKAEKLVESLRSKYGIDDPMLENPSQEGRIFSLSDEFKRAQSNLENERFIYDQLNLRLRQEMVSMQIPRSLVEIIDTAMADRRPVSPNLFMNVMISLIPTGVVAAAGLVLLLAGLRRKAAPSPVS